MPEPNIHDLKIWPEHLEGVLSICTTLERNNMEIKMNFEDGAFMLHRMGGKGGGTLVQVQDIKEVDGKGKWASVHYVQVCHDGRVIGGGYSSSWPESDFAKITDPFHILAAQVFRCQQVAHESEHRAKAAKAEEGSLMAAMEALRIAQANIAQAEA